MRRAKAAARRPARPPCARAWRAGRRGAAGRGRRPARPPGPPPPPAQKTAAWRAPPGPGGAPPQACPGRPRALATPPGDAVVRAPRGPEQIRLPRRDGRFRAAAIAAALAERGLRHLFIKGGGVTVSSFLAEAMLDRLQVTV